MMFETGADDPVVVVPKPPKKYFQRTKLCRFHAIGACEKGSACNFAHGNKDMQELPNFSKTRLCKAFMETGTCEEGADCKFAHGREELRNRRQLESKSSGPPTAKGKSGNSSKGPQAGTSQHAASEEQIDRKAFMETGTCEEGAECKFARGREELRARKQLQSKSPGPPTAKGKSGNSSKGPQVGTSQHAASAEQVDQKVLMMHAAMMLYHQQAAMVHLSLAHANTFADWSRAIHHGAQGRPKELKGSDVDRASLGSESTESTHADSRSVSKESLPLLSELVDNLLPMRVESELLLREAAPIEKIMKEDNIPLRIPVALEEAGFDLCGTKDMGLITVQDGIPLRIPVAPEEAMDASACDAQELIPVTFSL